MVDFMPSYVAGTFYPDSPSVLRKTIEKLLQQSKKHELSFPKAIISPHAGYIYSGPIAATVYSTLMQPNEVTKVVLFGPAHRYPLIGVSGTEARFFHTPLGKIQVNTEIMEELINSQLISCIDQSFVNEHCLEVQLPFLQVILNDFEIIPLLVGNCDYKVVSEIIEKLEDDNTLFVISSDLSHYHNYDAAKQFDKRTTEVIKKLSPNEIDFDDACGRVPIQGLLNFVKKNGYSVKVLDVRNSGDTAGDKEKVVGYGAFHFR